MSTAASAPHTTTMKLSDLRPCDACSGTLRNGIFHVVEYRVAVVNADEANQTLSLAQFFGGGAGAFTIAEVMSPTPNAVKVAAEPSAKLYLCTECLCRPVSLAELAERRADAERADDDAGEPTETRP